MWLPTLDTIDPNNLSNLIQGFWPSKRRVSAN